MSKPITTDLRRKMDTLGWYDEDGNIVYTTGGKPASEIACLVINSKTFGELCDAIDAVQANLERENDALYAENDALRHERDDGWVELPRDADGETIHAGDELEVGNGKREKVKFMTLCTDGGWLINEQGWLPIYSHHVKSDTWERIIEDAITYAVSDTKGDRARFDALVARCRALAGDV